jgi:hypothetical protein
MERQIALGLVLSRPKANGNPDDIVRWSLTSLRKKLVKIGAKLVVHGRYMTFQIAEVAVPRDLFRRILQMIDGLRPRRMARC